MLIEIQNRQNGVQLLIGFVNIRWRIQQKNEVSGDIFKCYHDFGCFTSEQEAYDDAQIEADRIIY